MTQTCTEAAKGARADALVFFGISGNLAKRKVLPALARLALSGLLTVPIIGVAKAGWSKDDLLAHVKLSLTRKGDDGKGFAALAPRLSYVDGDFADEATFSRVRAELGKAERPLHYLAVPPVLFAPVCEGLGLAGCAPPGASLMVEKPFGHDLASAVMLNNVISRYFSEDAVFRVDHYLGKEGVLGLLFFRFANAPFEPMWNRTHVRSIQITMAETLDVSDRARFYDRTGAIRDVVQNHLLQFLSLATMDAPSRQDPDALRLEKARLLRSICPLSKHDVVRGQYQGYLDTKGVPPGSRTETYVALRLALDDWRWAGVPVLIRTGKCLPVTATELLVEMQSPPPTAFSGEEPRGGYVRVRVTPTREFALGCRVKMPGEAIVGEEVELLASATAGGDVEAYDRLFSAALRRDPTLFASLATVEAAWRVVDPVLDPDATPLTTYARGSWGPVEAEQLARDVGGWHDPLASAAREVSVSKS